MTPRPQVPSQAGRARRVSGPPATRMRLRLAGLAKLKPLPPACRRRDRRATVTRQEQAARESQPEARDRGSAREADRVG